jgi:DNA N-6-adenine-methyltransferase (Dam)
VKVGSWIAQVAVTAPTCTALTTTPTIGRLNDYRTPVWFTSNRQNIKRLLHPPHVFERLGIEFDLDVAAPPEGCPWIPAKRFLTMADDGLSAPWEGKVWMNPPYSQATPWVNRFINHRNGICLVPWAKSAWAIKLWNAADAVAIDADGFFDFIGGSISSAVWFAAFGDECSQALSRIGKVR